MKTLLIMLLLAAPVAAQNGYTTFGPEGPPSFQVSARSFWASGHWVSTGKATLPGPSVSEITCDRRACHDVQANIESMGGAFVLSAANEEYAVERWSREEIVAGRVGGTCLVRNVLTIDLVHKRVFFAQFVPKTADKMCNPDYGLELELKGSAMFVRTAK